MEPSPSGGRTRDKPSPAAAHRGEAEPKHTAPAPADAGPVYRRACALVEDFPRWEYRENLNQVFEGGWEKADPVLLPHVREDRGVVALLRDVKGSQLWDFVGDRTLSHATELPDLEGAWGLARYLLARGKYLESTGRRRDALECYLATRRLAVHVAQNRIAMATFLKAAIDEKVNVAMQSVSGFPRDLRELAVRECSELAKRRVTLQQLLTREKVGILNSCPLCVHEFVQEEEQDREWEYGGPLPKPFRLAMLERGTGPDVPWVKQARGKVEAAMDELIDAARRGSLAHFTETCDRIIESPAPDGRAFGLRFVLANGRLRTAAGAEREQATRELDEVLGDFAGEVMRLMLFPDYALIAGEEHRTFATSCARIYQWALENYREDQAHFPQRLEELVPRYLERTWPDPFDEKPFRYRRVGQQYLLYSIGPDLEDDGGQIPYDPTTREGDLLFGRRAE